LHVADPDNLFMRANDGIYRPGMPRAAYLDRYVRSDGTNAAFLVRLPTRAEAPADLLVGYGPDFWYTADGRARPDRL
jgi:hypothetical protein